MIALRTPASRPVATAALLAAVACLLPAGFSTPAAADLPVDISRPAPAFTPFSQTTPTGVYGRTMLASNPTLAGTQAVEVRVAGGGRAEVYRGDGTAEQLTDGVAALQVGRVYRLKIDGFAAAPGAAVYPTVELVDRLHPPEGLQRDFPVVIEFTAEEVEAALSERLVTKVVYVRPRHDIAVLRDARTVPLTPLPATANPVAEAVLRGRPIAVVRIGSRTPLSSTDRAFFVGGPVAMLRPESDVRGVSHVCGPACPDGCRVMALPSPVRVELPVVDGTPRPVSTADLYPDEYICDGGDTGFTDLPADEGRVEMGYEETVGQYTTDTQYAGEAAVRLAPSTRTCLYAPAFAAVRTISGLLVDSTVLKVAGAHDSRRVAGAAAKLAVAQHRQSDAGAQARVRSRVSELDRNLTDSNVSRVQGILIEEQLLNAFMDSAVLVDQELSRETVAVLQDRVQGAGEWSTDQTPVVSAYDETESVVSATTAAEAKVHYEDRRPDGKLRIIKTADVRSAKPGETVRFSLRFENLGGRPVREVVISDHLSPRLRLDEDSVRCTLPAEVSVEDDFTGSVYLRVTLKDELPPRTGGTITFATTVR